jgi:hypothetical protein
MTRADQHPRYRYHQRHPGENQVEAVDDAYATAEDTTLTIAAPGVLVNDSMSTITFELQAW